MSILPCTNKIEALMKLKPPTNIKEVRHFISLTGYYHKFICNYVVIRYPLNCLRHKSQPFIWTPECQSSFNMLCSWLTNTIVYLQLPDPNKLYLLFMDTSKYCYSGMLTEASTEDSNKALTKMLTDKDPSEGSNPQTQNLQLESNDVHSLAYISGNFSESQCRWPAIRKNVLVSLCQSKYFPFICKMPIY